MRGRSPLGNPLLWIVAAFVLPEVVKKCKPFAKAVGDTLVSAGEAFRRASEEPVKTEAPLAKVEEAKTEEEPVAVAEVETPAATHTEPFEPTFEHEEPEPPFEPAS